MSTGRFVALWAACQGAIHALVNAAQAWVFMEGRSRSSFGTTSAVLRGFGALLMAFVGAAILSRCRRRVKGWAWGYLGGTLAGALVADLLIFQLAMAALSQGAGAVDPRWLSWAFSGVGSVSGSLLLAASLGLALWGRRWPPTALIWLAGFIAVGLLATLVPAASAAALPTRATAGMGTVDPAFLLRWTALGLLTGAMCGAGTAWLLDRCEFRRAAAEPPAA